MFNQFRSTILGLVPIVFILLVLSAFVLILALVHSIILGVVAALLQWSFRKYCHKISVFLFRVILAIMLSAIALGQAIPTAPDFGKARLSLHRIFALVDQAPLTNCYSTTEQEKVSFRMCTQMQT